MNLERAGASWRRRRSHIAMVAALSTALALLAGCGGRAIEQAQPAFGAGAGVTTDGGHPAPGVAGQNPQVPTESGETVPAPADPPAGAGEREVSPGADLTPNQEGARQASRAGGSAAGRSSVERLVASHPLFGGKAPCRPATLPEVPIGNVSTLSGVLGELFSPIRPALDTFVAAQNACGGLNGHRIKLYVEDDQGDPSAASTKVQSLIQDKKVLALVGNIQVLTIDAVVPVVKRFKIPLIGGDLASNTWFQNPLMFPQGPPPAAVAYGYLVGATEYFKKKNVGDIWCIEVPRSCEQNDRALKELAPDFGVTMKKSLQASITAPSYVQQCLEFQRSGVEALALLMDAASMNRLARSCTQVGYQPKLLPASLGVGNERQFLTGNEWLGDSYVPVQFSPWIANETPAQKYWQAAVRKYNPGTETGVAFSAGWTAGALLVAAAAELSPTRPTTADLLRGLYTFQGQKWTGLGGLVGPRTFVEGEIPKVPYCFFSVISNPANDGWSSSTNKPRCTDKLAPSDPQLAS